MAATSRPDLVDVALLRPGRIDKSVYCGFPSVEERKAIIKVYLEKFKYKRSEEGEEEEFLGWLGEKTEGFTSADLKGLI
jgi:peroxin-1